MEALVKCFEYEGNKVTFRDANGVAYANATEMAKPFGKKPNDYLRLPSTQDMIKACARKYRTSESHIVVSKMGSPESGGGTWLQETLALDYAQWLSVDFRLWCNDRIKEVLKFGFTATEYTLDKLINNPDLVISLASQLKIERQEKETLKIQNYELKEENSILSAENGNMKPKAIFADAVASSKTSILIADLATFLKQNGYDTGQNRLFKKLREEGYLVKSGSRYNMPTQYAMNLGLFEVKETAKVVSDKTEIYKTTKVTGKGQCYFVNKFLAEKDKAA